MNSTPEISEYSILTFFWEKFGISGKELKDCNAEWVQTMLTIGGAESDATHKRIDNIRTQK